MSRLRDPRGEDLPPLHIRRRATGNTDPEAFRAVGSHLAGVFGQVIGEYFRAPRVLDWGCGPGRVAARLLESRPGWELCGCDVDHEAAAWCDAHLGPGAFRPCSLLPPLPWPTENFDAVIACSVFTHLKRLRQHEWLRELARVLRPGGLLVASVHGEPARRIYIPRIPTILDDNGIFDELISRDMEGVILQGEYRVTFQSESWTRDNWGKHLEVIGYKEAGLTPEHDLVICRKDGEEI